MQFDAAIVAQESSRRAEAELGPDRHQPSHSKTVFLLTQVDREADKSKGSGIFSDRAA